MEKRRELIKKILDWHNQVEKSYEEFKNYEQEGKDLNILFKRNRKMILMMK